MAQSIDIGSLGDELEKIVNFYGSEVLDTLNAELAAYAEVVRDEVGQRSPVLSADTTVGGGYRRRRGRYSRGWRVSELWRYGKKVFIVHNKTDPQLTHLLEKGATREKQGVMPAQPHIAPAYDNTVEQFWTDLQYKLGLL